MENAEIDLIELIETVIEQGCVALKNGLEGIPRSITITPENTCVTVSTDKGTDDYDLSEIKKIIFIG